MPTEWRKSSSGNSFWACGDAKQWPTVLRGASATGFRSSPPRGTVLSSDPEGPPARCRCLDPSSLRQSSDGDGRKGARQKWHGDRQTGTKDAGRPGTVAPSTGIQLGTLRLQQPLVSHPVCYSKIPCPPKCRAARDDAPGGIARASVHPRDKWSEEGTGSRRGQGWRAASRARAEGDVWRGTGSEEERGPRPPLQVAFGARACGGEMGVDVSG